jgi:hypothetical protein
VAHILPLLIARRILTEGDLASFASYGASIGRMIAAQRILRRGGSTDRGVPGPQRHPAISIMNDAQMPARQLDGGPLRRHWSARYRGL